MVEELSSCGVLRRFEEHEDDIRFYLSLSREHEVSVFLSLGHLVGKNTFSRKACDYQFFDEDRGFRDSKLDFVLQQ